MLYKLRTGDVVLCKNKPLNQTNAYLIVYDDDNGFGLWCLGCGEAVGFFGKDTEKFKQALLDENFLHLQTIVPKELLADYFNKNYKLDLPVKAHDGFNELNIIIEIEK